MITTNCPKCNAPMLVSTAGAIFGTYAPVDCGECGTTNVVEVTRMGGKTYTQDEFENSVLPDMDDMERIDHPSGEATIYGNPDEVGVIE